MSSGHIRKDQWLDAALVELEIGGIEVVRIDVLAKKLSVSRSGFVASLYWLTGQ
jgi:hypothetical protein